MSGPDVRSLETTDRWAIVGAGRMGLGLASLLVQRAIAVTLVTRREPLVVQDCAREGLLKAVSTGKLTEAGAREAVSRLAVTSDYACCGDGQVILECVEEDLPTKARVLVAVEAAVRPDALIATNTSSLSVTELSQALAVPERFLGLHFFNPVHATRVVEVVRGGRTLDDTVALALDWVERVGKTGVCVADTPGFIVNRMLLPMVNTAVALWADRAASAADIDTALVLGANHPMGPLALGDYIGWDVINASLVCIHAGTSDAGDSPHPAIHRLVASKRLGRKAGVGVYAYSAPGGSIVAPLEPPSEEAGVS